MAGSAKERSTTRPTRANRPSWPTREVAVPTPVVKRVGQFAETVGLSRVDMITLLATTLPLTPGLADRDPEYDAAMDTLGKFREKWKRITDDPTRPTPSLYEADIPFGSDLAVLRLGPARSDETPMPKGGYERDARGADLHYGPDETWDNARGYWNFGHPLPHYLVATRLGRILGTYAIDNWLPIADGSRVFAKTGWILDPASGRARPTGAGDRRSRALTANEKQVVDAFTPSEIVSFPGRGTKDFYRLGANSSQARNATSRHREKSA